MDQKRIIEDFQKLLVEGLDEAQLEEGEIFVLGMSTSEIAGGRIGKASYPAIAKDLVEVALNETKKRKIFLACQCCEHLNRALVVEKTCMQAYSLEEVSVIPKEDAGGSLATEAYRQMDHPYLVERIQGHAGMDVGDTFIGMHLKAVVVPVRLSLTELGQAHLTFARTRPKLIGGARAIYN